jgi:hypothetical protein
MERAAPRRMLFAPIWPIEPCLFSSMLMRTVADAAESVRGPQDCEVSRIAGQVTGKPHGLGYRPRLNLRTAEAGSIHSPHPFVCTFPAALAPRSQFTSIAARRN